MTIGIKKLFRYLGQGSLAVILVVLSNPGANAEIYRWVDDNGKVNFSDQPPGDSSATQVEIHINSYTKAAVGAANSESAVNPKVVMYSASWCSICKQAKSWFERKDIAYSEYDIERSEKGKRDYKKLNGTGVPIILVGRKRINGFSPETFDKVYNSRNL